MVSTVSSSLSRTRIAVASWNVLAMRRMALIRYSLNCGSTGTHSVSIQKAIVVFLVSLPPRKRYNSVV